MLTRQKKSQYSARSRQQTPVEQKGHIYHAKIEELDHSQIQALLVPTKQKSSRIALRRQTKDGNRAITRLEQLGKLGSESFGQGHQSFIQLNGKGIQNGGDPKLIGKRNR